MAPHQDDLALGLQEAIKTTLVQLCKVGIVYQCELAIAGTVGVTVDRKRTILVHFDERLDPCQPDTSSVGVVPPNLDLNTVGNGVGMDGAQAMIQAAGSSQLLLPLQASPPQQNPLSVPVSYTDLAQFTHPSTSTGSKNEAYIQTSLPASLPVSIDIESDSDSLCELGFDDDVIEVDPSTMIRKKEVMWSGEDDFDIKKHHIDKVEVKCADSDVMDMDSTSNMDASTDDTEPTSSVLVPDNSATACLMNPPRLLIDKRLFLKKMSPEKTQALSTVAAAVALATATSTDGSNVTAKSVSHKPQLSCEVCGKIYLTHGLLEAHLVEAHGVVYSALNGHIVHFTCKHCNKKFRYQATLDKHEFLHVADKPFKCHICNNTYCYAESLQIHMNVHAGILDCLICQKMYSSRKHLQKHIVYMHEMRRVRSGTTPKKPRLLALEEPEQDS